MAENSKIEWTDHTFNPWRGCSKVAPGCAHCYAEVNVGVKLHGIQWGPNGTRVRAADAGWREPLKWNRAAAKAGERRRVFCASLADVFEDWNGFVLDHNGNVILQCDSCENPDGTLHRESVKPFDRTTKYFEHGCGEHFRPLTLGDLRRDLFALIDATPWLDWQLLTKRPENVRRMWPAVDIQSQAQADDRNERGELFRRNVWLGTSISDQATADKNLPELLKCRDLVPVLFASAEPLLGPIDFDFGGTCKVCGNTPDRDGTLEHGRGCYTQSEDGGGEEGFRPQLDWIIVGGESGPHARECDVAAVRSIVWQCEAVNIPVLVKQLGSNPRHGGILRGWPTGVLAMNNNANELVGLRDSKGGDPSEWPEDIRVRQFPRPFDEAAR